MAAVYGDGFGRKYIPEVPTEEIGTLRREKQIITVVGGQQVTLVVRDTIVPFDPYLNMVRAAAYPYQMGGGADARFPVPPVGRDIKDVLIKTIIQI
jgi:hypothetical protein